LQGLVVTDQDTGHRRVPQQVLGFGGVLFLEDDHTDTLAEGTDNSGAPCLLINKIR
jgi:hypothetical protein